MKISLLDEFEWLSASVLEGDASREEVDRFNELIREYPELVQIYLEQLQMHVILECRGGGLDRLESVRFDVRARGRQETSGRKTGWRTWRTMAAAAAAILLTGTAVWYAGDTMGSAKTATSSVPAVRLMSQTGVRGLDLPGTLPGMLRLESGEAVVRLESGVELTVLGPASLEVRDNMQVALERGRLLANVPHWATGFRVRTADLDVCDLGTVFSVSVDFPVTDVFVFKGRVQVDEAGHGGIGNSTSGESVGLCGAGEGVRAEAGERPVKFAADWPAAKKVFASVRDQAATVKAASAFAAAGKIADLWVEAYLPRELSRLSAQRLAASASSKIPFSKTAWVRPTVPQQEEASNMNKASAAAVLVAATMAAGSGSAFSGPAFVNTFPARNRCWETVYTNAVPLAWSWNWVTDTASSVQLDIVGMNGSVTTNFASPTTNWVWQAFAQSTPSAEDVYELTLTFYNGGGSAVGALTSRLAVVNGAFGKAFVDPVPSSAAWSKVKGNSVIPFDAGWAKATVSAVASRLVIAQADGRTVQTNALADAAGYFGWKLKRNGWGYGTFNLALTFPGTAGGWDATLTRPVDGTMIRIR